MIVIKVGTTAFGKWSRRRTAQCLETVCLAVPAGDHGAEYLIGARTKFSVSSSLGAISSHMGAASASAPAAAARVKLGDADRPDRRDPLTAGRRSSWWRSPWPAPIGRPC